MVGKYHHSCKDYYSMGYLNKKSLEYLLLEILILLVHVWQKIPEYPVGQTQR
jgi:hypothetical protein